MTGYKVYLTRSREVASLIAEALKPSIHEESSEADCTSVSYGKADERDFIPNVYSNTGYFYACIKYEGLTYPLYELHFA